MSGTTNIISYVDIWVECINTNLVDNLDIFSGLFLINVTDVGFPWSFCLELQ